MFSVPRLSFSEGGWILDAWNLDVFPGICAFARGNGAGWFTCHAIVACLT
jgi:hypothetical protein